MKEIKTMSLLKEIKEHDQYSGQFAGWMALLLEFSSWR
jgi:hypothetical protein